MTPAGPAVWAGVESAHLRVGDRIRDQLAETGHDRRISDLDRLPELGVRAVRYPVLWGRDAGGLRRDATDWTWAAARLERLGALGIDPMVELLHHGFGPPGADPRDPRWPERFGAYAGQVARRFPWVHTWLPINEPLTTARFAGLYGWWWPHRMDMPAFARLLLAQCLAVRAATRAIRAEIPGAVIVVNEDAGAVRGTPEVAGAVRHDDTRRWLAFDLLTGRVVPGHPFWGILAALPGIEPSLVSLAADPASPDVLGLDYYITSDRWLDHRTYAFPAELRGGGHGLEYVDVEAVRVVGVAISGFEHALRTAWDRYHLPLALTEVQLAGGAVDQVAWWQEAWRSALEAQATGVDVRAVTAWGVFGSWDWDSVLRVTGRTWAPGCLSSDGGPAGEALVDAIHGCRHVTAANRDASGWWRRIDRAMHDPTLGRLIVGAG